MSGNTDMVRSADPGKAMRILRGRQGVAGLEFALVAPMLVLLFMTIGAYGSVMWAKMQVESAARAGAAYAAKHGFDTAGIAGAVSGATSLGGVTASPAPTRECRCAEAKGLVPAACNVSCGSGADPGEYVVVHAQATYSPLINLPGLGQTVALSSTAPSARIP